MEVELFIPCFVDQLYPQTGVNTVKLLRKAGCQVHYNPTQTCCGQAAFNAGQIELAKPIARKWVADLGSGRQVVSPSASCVGMVINYMPGLLDNVQIPQTSELSSFLVDKLGFSDFGATLNEKAVYHDSCAALRECKVKTQPRILLDKVKGLTLLPLEDNETCCGFGGTFAVKFEAVSVAMAQQKVDQAIKSGASLIISTDWSCLMHMQGYISKENIPLRTMHLADVLASGW